MKFFSYSLFLFFSLVMVLAFPLYQALQTGGYVFFVNALDEGSYLQYDYSIAIASLASPGRPGQWVVNVLHELGMSGGWINVLLDAFAFLAAGLFLPLIFFRTGFSRERARLQSVICIAFPLAFTHINPLMEVFFDWIISSGSVYWITTPISFDHPFLRSPEPQVSLVLALVGVFIGVSQKSFLPPLIISPVLYPFVGIPLGIGAITLWFLRIFGSSRGIPVLTLCITTGLAGMVLGFWTETAVPSEVKRFMVQSFLPLFSITGSIALFLFIFYRKRIPHHCQTSALVMSCLPFVVVNLQVFGGWLIQPGNYEQYAGILLVTLIFAFTVRDSACFRMGTLFFCCILFFLEGVIIFAKNQNVTNFRQDELMDIAQGKMLTTDIRTATTLNLLYSKQEPTFFSITRTYVPLSDRYRDIFQCARPEIEEKYKNDRKVKEALALHERWYRTQHEDYILNTIGRKSVLIDTGGH